MDGYIVPAAAVAAVIALLTFGVPAVLREFFPIWLLYAHRHGRPTVRTASYAGRTALVTGAHGAFGSRAARLFAERGVGTLVLVDVADCADVKADIEKGLEAAGKPVPEILVWKIDMMSFEGCREVGMRARKELKALDHALMTAGILSTKRRVSPEGWETSVQVNFLSSALIGLLLLPVLKSSPGNPNPPVLTFVTTFAVYPSLWYMGVPKTGSYLEYVSDNDKHGTDQQFQYGRSKGLLLMFARELASRVSAAVESGNLKGKVTVNSADPGSAWTNLTNPTQSSIVGRNIMNFGVRDPIICATALVNGVSSPADAHGKVVEDFEYAPYPPFMERKGGKEAQRRLWEETKAEFEKKVVEVKDIYERL